MDALMRTHFVFGGRVQGVGFRFAVQLAASQAGVSGWVKNEDDGTVTCELEGTADQIERVILTLVTNERQGRARHRLSIESRTNLKPVGESGFSIRR